MDEGNEAFDRIRFALEHRLDRPVAVVAHPTGDAVRDRAPADRVSEEHSLNVPVDDDARADHTAMVATTSR